MKTVFISAFQSFVSRNILNTGVLEEMKRKEAKVVILVSPLKKEYYTQIYAEENVFVESFDIKSDLSLINRKFRNFSTLLINTNIKRFHKEQMRYEGGGLLRYLFERFITATLGRITFIKKLFRFFEAVLNKQDAFGKLFEKYKPDVVFATNVYGEEDVLLMKSASIHGVKTIGMVLSWDNNTSKHLMRVVPNVLLVQNEIIKDEAIKIQNVPEGIIKIVGISHYDYYKTYLPVSRDEYFNRIGADSKKRLIVFSPAGNKFISTDWQICQILKEAFIAGTIPDDLLILIRVHPTNPSDLSKFVPDEHFLIENPGFGPEGVRDKEKELDISAMHHLIDTLHHSELVINVVSSLVIDASVLDKPIITIAFEGLEERVPFVRSVKRYLMEENMAKLLKVGGTLMATSPDDLIKKINYYLENPEADKEGRMRIVDRQCWKLDGNAKFRIANLVINDTEI